MASNYQINEITVDDREIVERAFVHWYKKNNSVLSSKIFDVVSDMFEAPDTRVFLIGNGVHHYGVFYFVDSNDELEICGGLLPQTNHSGPLTHFVLRHALEVAQRINRQRLVLFVNNQHYKYSVIIAYYERLGFTVSQRNDATTKMAIMV